MTAKKTSVTYGQLQQQLDEVLARLENPRLDIDDATVAYEEGLALIKQLAEQLARAENRISKAQADFAAETGK